MCIKIRDHFLTPKKRVKGITWNYLGFFPSFGRFPELFHGLYSLFGKNTWNFIPISILTGIQPVFHGKTWNTLVFSLLLEDSMNYSIGLKPLWSLNQLKCVLHPTWYWQIRSFKNMMVTSLTTTIKNQTIQNLLMSASCKNYKH